jgi:hypothetical protein
MKRQKQVVKIIKITNCVSCPNSAASEMLQCEHKLCCYHIDVMDKKIVDRIIYSEIIPKWCPL